MFGSIAQHCNITFTFYAFSRRFYPKRLTIFMLYIFLSVHYKVHYKVFLAQRQMLTAKCAVPEDDAFVWTERDS